MNTLIIETVILFTWFDFYEDIPFLHKARFKMNFKPFNCLWCLSFWVGVITSLFMQDAMYICLPLITKILDR